MKVFENEKCQVDEASSIWQIPYLFRFSEAMAPLPVIQPSSPLSA